MFRPFPESLRFGAATSATQIEGHCEQQDWLRFAREPGRTQDGGTPEVACDHWRRMLDDVGLITGLGLQAYRFSVEWARIEPSPGRIDHAALDQYRQLLGALNDAGVVPYVTLHHFTLPLWAYDEGGLLWEELPARMVAFTEATHGALKDLCVNWITINEPNVVCAQGFLNGEWPPAESGQILKFIRSQRNLLQAHVGMYRAIKAQQPEARVGLAHHLRVIQPEREGGRGDKVAAKLMDKAFNTAFVDAVCFGTMTALDPLVRAAGGFDPREARGTQDFFGLNYYSRDLVRFSLDAKDSAFIKRSLPGGAATTDLGWEIYPEGLEQLITHWSRQSGLPVAITENGLADHDDDQRPRFLLQHLDAVGQAIDKGAEVEAYLHWSLMDNFEWAEGYGPRFGLYAVDYATQARTLRPSGELYRALIKERAITDGMWAKHVR